MIRKMVCQKCGVVNDIDTAQLAADNDDWLQCTLPEGFEWTLPAGKITPVVGDPIYVSAMGEHLSRLAYLQKYNIDPEIACQMMRGGLRDHMRTSSMNLKKSTTVLDSVKKLVSR